jgi:hypothetical protein
MIQRIATFFFGSLNAMQVRRGRFIEPIHKEQIERIKISYKQIFLETAEITYSRENFLPSIFLSL